MTPPRIVPGLLVRVKLGEKTPRPALILDDNGPELLLATGTGTEPRPTTPNVQPSGRDWIALKGYGIYAPLWFRADGDYKVSASAVTVLGVCPMALRISIRALYNLA